MLGDGALPHVSVIIRNRNEAVHLQKVLAALSVQVGPPLEIIVVDNASADDSVAIAQNYGAKVVHLPAGDFTYGRGLNTGLRVATGDICVILSAHSLPMGKRFITACIAPFSDPEIAAARCVYIGKGSDAMRWTAPELLDASASLEDVISKGPLASGCVIRRAVWLAIPFDEQVTAAEDKLWARAVLQGGYRIVSPCDAFYTYIKPVPPAIALRNSDRDNRAVFHATGVRFGAAKISPSTTIFGAGYAIATEVPRAVFAVVGRELTKVRLRLAFPSTPHSVSPLNGQ